MTSGSNKAMNSYVIQCNTNILYKEKYIEEFKIFHKKTFVSNAGWLYLTQCALTMRTAGEMGLLQWPVEEAGGSLMWCSLRCSVYSAQWVTRGSYSAVCIVHSGSLGGHIVHSGWLLHLVGFCSVLWDISCYPGHSGILVLIKHNCGRGMTQGWI